MATPVANSVALLTATNNNNGTLTDEFISGLAQGGSWTFAGPRVITYSLNINDDGVSYPDGPPQPGAGGTWDESPAMKVAVERALRAWSNFADVQFQQIDSGEYYFESSADLAITLTGDDLDFSGFEVVGLSHFPDPDYVDSILADPGDNADRTSYPAPEGDVFFDNFDAHFEFLGGGAMGLTVILHEIGHALGLKHPFDDGGNGRPSFEELGVDDRDRLRYTLMSGDFVFLEPAAHGFAATPMPLDILAIQHIYGANMSHRTGDDTYGIFRGGFRTIWDAGGHDTLSAASWTGPNGVLIDLREGEYTGNRIGAKRTAIAYGVTIEDATGSNRADSLIGNGADNVLDGGAGDDTLSGGEGNDRLRGGAGADLLSGGAGNDILHWGGVIDAGYDGGAGTDKLRVSRGNLDLSAVAGRVTDIEKIGMRGGGDSTLTLSEQDVLDISSTSDTLTINGDAGDAVDIAGEFTVGPLVDGYRTYTVGAATLLVHADITDVG